MELHRKTFAADLRGEKISIEVSELAGQANAAVIGRHGGTAVLATVVMGKEDRQGDFFPLTVDYEERFYAAGKIIGSRFVRREGRPSDEATLSARLIDRTIRPLFDHRLRREVQVVITVLAYDEEHDPDVVGLLAASSALAISDIPWGGPVAGVQTVRPAADGKPAIKAYFAGLEEFVNMIELEGKEIADEDAERLFAEAHEEIKKLVAFQKKIVSEIGKPKQTIALKTIDPAFDAAVRAFLAPRLEAALKEKKLEELKTELTAHLSGNESFVEMLADALPAFEHAVDAYVHELALTKGERVDGRKLDEIRPLYGEVGLFEVTHGSGLFMRGQTQVLAVTTLASSAAEQLIETMETTGRRRFMLHYNFPNFSVGETGRSRGPGRREIGHGALAAKAVGAMIPPKDEFPYTIRVVAETLSSNGSSSQASTCAASLSLMDAGVPIKKHVGGIAIGLMLDENDLKNYKILTDIQGPEDHYGDMDFKVAGTDAGVNAIQMDVKIAGIDKTIFKEALAAARKARLQIIDVMNKVIPEARPSVSKYAPKITMIKIPVEKIGEIIGPGGKNINGLIASCDNKITIDIEEDGTVYIAGVDETLTQKAYDAIRATTREYRVGEIVIGPIIKILDFGAIVDLGGGRDGMIHVSELKEGFVKNVEDVVHLGQTVTAKVVRADPDGRIGLSLKNVLSNTDMPR